MTSDLSLSQPVTQLLGLPAKTAQRADRIKNCYLGPEISPEQFIPEHFFLYLKQGNMTAFDGYQRSEMGPGEACLVRKHRLARYSKQPVQGAFEKVVIVFDEPFLKQFAEPYQPVIDSESSTGAFMGIKPDPLIEAFIVSLAPYYLSAGQIDPAFSELKRQELLLILLRTQPDLAAVLFNFGAPEKRDLESFMRCNYTFNVSLERFAYLTGRSLSTFKRDFEQVFHMTPSRWLIKRRLEEAHFLLGQGQKPSDIYLELGFENFSHFSHAFKKHFGYTPKEVMGSGW